jgi:hypothetical protein
MDFNFVSNPPSNLAYKAEDDELFANGRHIQLKASNGLTANHQTAENAKAISDSFEAFSENLPITLRRGSIYDNLNEDDNDSEMTSLDGVSDPDNVDNDNSVNSLQTAGSNNFARTFFNNTRRRMSSGLVLSYNFLKGASNKRRDST